MLPWRTDRDALGGGERLDQLLHDALQIRRHLRAHHRRHRGEQPETVETTTSCEQQLCRFKVGWNSRQGQVRTGREQLARSSKKS